MGYEPTQESLTRAFNSGDAWAQIYSLMWLQENNDSAFLDMIPSLLKSSSIKVQLETAKLLSQFDRSDGIEWLQKWENIDINWESPYVDTANALLDAASALAKKGDERLAKFILPALNHKFWAIRIHAARALGDFRNNEKPELKAIWIASVDVALEALNNSTVREDFVELYLTWLVNSLFEQESISQEITAKFVELASMEHPVICRTFGVRIYQEDIPCEEKDAEK
ncbi:MAG: HEAT repeat domain-containing protein [candidate division Zixibacteria bacterium]